MNINLVSKEILLKVSDIETKICRNWIYKAYRRRFAIEWEGSDNPEFFNHEIDLYYQWPKGNEPFWLERGIYSIQALKMFKRPIVLELCCGDGFNSKNFYSSSAKQVVACDFDLDAIKQANGNNTRSNVKYILADIRTQMPQIKGCTNVIWDAAIEHFTEKEIVQIMGNIKNCLEEKNGILSGYTIVEKENCKSSLKQHEYEFKDMGDLKRFLKPYFKNVYIFETKYKERHNLYFYASNGTVPFSPEWNHSLT